MAAGALALAMTTGGIAHAQDPISIGVIANLTGTDVSTSQSLVRGIEIAAEEINAAGGINGAPISLIVEDSQYKTQEALNAARKLYDVDNVDVALMFGGSSLMLAVAPIVQEKGKILINTSSSSPQLGNFAGTLFSILPLDDIVGKSLGDYLIAQGVKSAAFVVPNNTFGTGLMESISAAFAAGGGEVVAKIAYTEGQPDYRADLQQLLRTKPEAIVTAGYGDDSRTVFKNAKALGLDQTWYAAYPTILSMDDPEWMSGRFKGIDNGGTSGPVAEKVGEAYKAKFGEGQGELLPHVFYGYDGLMVVAEAMKKGGALAETLPTVVEGYEGATGAIVWDEKGQRIDAPMDIVSFENGTFSVVDHQ
ncbi:ABC transporter substrate-binding protein [Acuticoccus kandeliae]|uniref:ABC transporter substrate-binding protein n=1 Tax=Acuticoccus kandeliae TaxID=2073160 RepID=UPI00196B0B0E|nr:ABC transporter substrate-binding protein [Acuticoccus kandeliae]